MSLIERKIVQLSHSVDLEGSRRQALERNSQSDRPEGDEVRSVDDA